MDLEKIERLLDIVARSGMAEVELEEGEFRLVVRAVSHQAAPAAMPPSMPAVPYGGGYPVLAPTAAETPAGPPPEARTEAPRSTDDVVVQAPIVGTFYRAPSPDAKPFVEVGDPVAPGDVLCIIEAMKLMNEIQSEHAGTVRQVLAGNAEPVEYDQPLFVIEKA